LLGFLEFLAWKKMDSVVSPAASLRPLDVARGRVERRFATVFRREAEASLYLEAKAAAAKTKATATAKANAGVSPLRDGR
jgi:hypothetical protein